MDENNLLICAICHQPILPQYYYCPNCGHNLKEKPVPISALIQLGVYALSIFLPPLGLWPGIKYVMKKSPQARKVGLIVIVLTVTSTAITLWAIFALFQNYTNQLNSVMTGLY